MGAGVDLSGNPPEDHAADVLGSLSDRVAQLTQPRVGRVAMSGDLVDDQARITTRLNLIEPETARLFETR